MGMGIMYVVMIGSAPPGMPNRFLKMALSTMFTSSFLRIETIIVHGNKDGRKLEIQNTLDMIIAIDYIYG